MATVGVLIIDFLDGLSESAGRVHLLEDGALASVVLGGEAWLQPVHEAAALVATKLRCTESGGTSDLRIHLVLWWVTADRWFFRLFNLSFNVSGADNLFLLRSFSSCDWSISDSNKTWLSLWARNHLNLLLLLSRCS